jgi:hypothetical protein
MSPISSATERVTALELDFGGVTIDLTSSLDHHGLKRWGLTSTVEPEQPEHYVAASAPDLQTARERARELAGHIVMVRQRHHDLAAAETAMYQLIRQWQDADQAGGDGTHEEPF